MNYRKIVSSILTVAMLMCTLTACSSKMVEAKAGDNIKTLDSQEKEINDVLSIKKIIEVEDFKGYKWLDDNRILGISYKNDDYSNIAIYNIAENTVEELTDFKGSEKYIETLKVRDHATCYYQYKELIKDFVLFSVKNRGGRTYEILSYDLKNNKLVNVDENVGAFKYADNNQLYYTKGFQLFRYDLVSNSKTEIQLPVDLTNNLKSFFSTFEEYDEGAVEAMKEQGLSKNAIDRALEQDKESYEYEKMNNRIDMIDDIEGEEIELISFNRKWYTYDMKNNAFREGEIEHEYEHSRELLIGKVAKVLIDEDELWKIDNEGNNIKLIGTTPQDFVKNFYLSLDETKLIYEVDPSEKEEKIIYDFDTDKKITISGNYYSCYFNEDSNKIIFNPCYKNVSKIVILNN